MKTLKKRGFEPLGYSGKGYLVIRHKETGFQTELPSTPSDYRSTKNLDATIEKGIKWTSGAGPQFEQWMYEKWGVEPGKTKTIECRLPEQIRLFFTEKNVHGVSRNAVNSWVRSRPNWRNLQPELRGRGPRTWEISRPALNVVEAVDPEEFWEPEDGETLVVEPAEELADEVTAGFDPPEAGELVIEVEPEPEPVSPNGRIVENPLDPEMIRRLTEALAGPELAEQQNRIQLARTELEALDGHLTAQIEEVTKARDVIRDLIAILEG